MVAPEVVIALLALALLVQTLHLALLLLMVEVEVGAVQLLVAMALQAGVAPEAVLV